MLITILEDDETLAFSLETYFKNQDYTVRVFKTLTEALSNPIYKGFYLVDIALPDGLGYDYGKEIIKTNDTMLIYLSAKDDQKSIIEGFQSGSDDYLTKPFTFEELDLRMKAIQKRHKESIITLGNLSIDTNIAIVKNKEEELFLSVQEFRILLLLMRNKNHVVSRDSLNEALNILDYTQDNTLTVAIGRLRKKLEGIVKIEAVVKQGYKVTL